MVNQREEKLREKERELLKREQEVNEKLARMVSHIKPYNQLCMLIVLELTLRKFFPYTDQCGGIKRFSRSKYNTSSAAIASSGNVRHHEATVVLWP